MIKSIIMSILAAFLGVFLTKRCLEAKHKVQLCALEEVVKYETFTRAFNSAWKSGRRSGMLQAIENKMTYDDYMNLTD